jgi:hypothetical protein
MRKVQNGNTQNIANVKAIQMKENIRGWIEQYQIDGISIIAHVLIKKLSVKRRTVKRTKTLR